MLFDEELMDALPGVRVDHDNAPHYRGLLERRLLINRCDDCDTWHHPPRSVCPACWSRSVTATEVRGAGRIGMLTPAPASSSGGRRRRRALPGGGRGADRADRPARVVATIVGARPSEI